MCKFVILLSMKTDFHVFTRRTRLRKRRTVREFFVPSILDCSLHIISPGPVTATFYRSLVFWYTLKKSPFFCDCRVLLRVVLQKEEIFIDVSHRQLKLYKTGVR